jgi:corrinoid protein of di/trimethylamine methyltransferase
MTKTQMEIFKELSESIINGDSHKALKAAEKIVEAGVDPLMAVEEGISSGAEKIGQMFERDEIYLPELLLAAEAIEAALKVLEPKIMEKYKGEKKRGCIVIGTVQGDIHDLGKNIVTLLLAANGYNVVDLGRDVPAMKFIEEAEKNNADIIGLSALMTTTKDQQREVIKMLEDLGLRDRYKVIVGGGVASEEWKNQIGADGYAKNAVEALALIDNILKEG